VVPNSLVQERLAELSELQDAITLARRLDLVGREVDVLVDRPGEGRTHREAPEIDGVVLVPDTLPVGSFTRLTVTGVAGLDLQAA
jgi:ribosomal protein S12 methylthiotransferase